MAKQNNKTHILFRYGLISLGFFLVAAAIVFKLIDTAVINAKAWNDRAKEEMSKIDTIPPVRGIILADNGAILACNVRVYDVKVDLRHSKILKKKEIPSETLDSLADSLDYYYPRHPRFAEIRNNPDSFARYSWRSRLARELAADPQKRTRSLRLVKGGTVEDFHRIKTFPLFKEFSGKGFRHPVYLEGYNKRMYPFGDMAHLSIGRVCQQDTNPEIHGYSGLEYALDPLLYGKPGYAKKMALTNGLSNWNTIDKQDGYDILSTINIDLQDIVEEELLSVCQELEAEWGTVILMEVQTGEIKAISNIEKLENGTYGESMNHAILPYEPGSVVKAISLMIALEDGLLNATETVETSKFQRTSDPHNPPRKNLNQMMAYSSNTGVARVIFRGYADHPEKWYDRLESIGFFDPMNSGLRPSLTPQVRRLEAFDSRGNNITMTARHLDLARQAFGYNTAIPPIYTLAYYNAIANGGVFKVPHLVRGIRLSDGRDSLFTYKWRTERVCSEHNAALLRAAIHDVVWMQGGTGQAVKDDRVDIAGKTGTAFPMVPHVGYDKSKRRFAFAGFFPYDNPKYSCMVVMQKGAGGSAARSSGLVMKNVALKMFARGLLSDTPSFAENPSNTSPTLAASAQSNSGLAAEIGTGRVKQFKAAPAAEQSKVPDMKGYDVASAVAILERRGLNVVIEGAGYVCSQSIAPGSAFKRGQTIKLTLKV